MAFNKLVKTNYTGIYYYNDSVKGKVYVAQFKVNGKRKRKIVGFSNDQFKTSAKMAFFSKENLILEHKNQKVSLPKKVYTLKKLYDEYIESVKHSQTVKTIETKEYYFKKHLEKNLGHLIVDEIHTKDIQNIVNNMLEKGYAPQTAKHLKNIVKAVYNYAIKMKYTELNIADDVTLPKFDNTIEYKLDTNEVKELFNTILNYKEEIYRGIFIFLLHGHRKSEVLNLDWKYIDLKNRIYEIPAKINKAKKNKKHPITDILYAVLINIDDKNGYVFKSPVTGTKFNDIKKAWLRIKKEANISKPFRIHDIRHLIANTTINELGMSSSVAAAILGHSTTKMVEERYSDVHVNTVANGLDMIFRYLQDKKSVI